MMPWFFFLFVGTYDWGFYNHALVSIEGAARVAALYTSTSSSTAADATTACTLALTEMQIASNLAGITTCGALPFIVTATAVTGPDGQPASQITITYRTIQLIPIPGVLQGQAVMYRTAQMRLRG